MSDPISPINRQKQERAENVSVQEEETKAAEKHKHEIESSVDPAEPKDYTNAMHMTRVQFQVNEDTNDVVIFIRDKKSDRILRTIPANAINDLPPGQFLNVSS